MSVLETIIAGTTGLVGVGLGAWLLERRERRRSQLDFVERQVKDFYSPMLGLRREIEARSEMRESIQEMASRAWEQLCQETQGLGPSALQELDKTRFGEFSKLIEYDNEKFEQESLPAYRRMVSLFRDSMWLADVDTREHYRTLVEYVEVWERFMAKALPREVLALLGHTEAKLHPFYAHVEQRLDELREQIRSGRLS